MSPVKVLITKGILSSEDVIGTISEMEENLAELNNDEVEEWFKFASVYEKYPVSRFTEDSMLPFLQGMSQWFLENEPRLSKKKPKWLKPISLMFTEKVITPLGLAYGMWIMRDVMDNMYGTEITVG